MKVKLITFTALLSLSTAALAANAPLYLWDNQEGLIKANSCSISPSDTTPFRISGYTGYKNNGVENLRNYNGVRQSHLVNGSLLKKGDEKERTNYENIEVVGINTNSNAKVNRWYSKRSDKGYLYKDSIHSIEDYILEIDHNSFKNLNTEKLNLPSSSYWFVESRGSYFNVVCDNETTKREYALFRVYSDIETSTEPSAFVGVYKGETSIFSNLKTFKVSELATNFETFEQDYDFDELISENTESQEMNDEEKRDVIQKKFRKNIKKVQEEEQETKDSTEVDSISTEESSEQENEEKPEVETEAETQEETNTETVTTTNGFFEEVVCIPSSSLNVRDESLETILFKAVTGEKVKKFQSFDNETKEYVLDGNTYQFVKVEFSSREESDQKVGWVASKFIKQKSKCKYLRDTNSINQVKDIEITGLDDENCCEFPTVKETTHSYTSGMRMFNARRGGGKRTHAACDLYRFKDEPILSVAPGRIARNHYYFYQGTYAIEVVHSGGFVVRYGELSGKKMDGLNHGSKVKMGQQIGYMGKVNSNCCRPMLHFELYKGSKTGPLSRSGNKYRRRSDLMDPTPYLRKWENGKF
jgi:murein DD-endopeptidase MepM/ murein hydrolase activator NlpD